MPTHVDFASPPAQVLTGPSDESATSSIRMSQRSTGSANSASAHSGGSGSGSNSKRLSSASLRGNLTQQHTGRDPLAYYEITKLLGEGSMGSVVLVRRRDSVIGASARYNMQERRKMQQKVQACFSLPLIGGLFENCFKAKASALVEKASLHSRDVSTATDATGVSTLSSTTSSSRGTSDLFFAMKSIHYKHVSDSTFVDELKNEVALLKSLDHPHIVRVMETFDYRNKLYVIMECCKGGDLYTRDPYTEEQAARITASILSAIAFMHEHDVIHRDLKYENILFVNDSPHAEVKLIDFGLSTKFADHLGGLTDGVGTIYTMAPEVLAGNYTQQADLWSIGVIAYMLMSSQMPFYGRKRSQIIAKIKHGEYEFRGRSWRRVSKQGKAFVDDLLVLDPNDRATAEEALRASWLNRRHTATVRSPDSQEIKMARQSIMNFSQYSKLRKVALMVIAHRSTSEEIGILRKVFQQYDTDGSGHLSFAEFKEAMDEAGYSDDDARDLFDAIDLDGTGFIRYTEFLAATIEATGAISEERLAEAFTRMDHHETGYISAENLKFMLGEDFPEDEIDAIIKETSGKNGKISYAEFLAQMEDNSGSVQEQMIRDVVMNESVDQISVLSSSEGSECEDHDGSDDAVVARVNFIQQKSLSERKLINLSPPEPGSPKRDSTRRVMFQPSSDPIAE